MKRNKIIILLLLFVILTILVYNNQLDKIDHYILNIMLKIRNNYFTFIFKTISNLFSTLSIIIYCIIFLLFMKNKMNAIKVSLILLFEMIINSLLKVWIKRQRPSVPRLVYETSFSYPSGHTMAATVLILILKKIIIEKYNLNKIMINILSYIVIFLVALSRIYLGVHYFSDTLGAIIIGHIIFLIFDTLGSGSNVNRNRRNNT